MEADLSIISESIQMYLVTIDRLRETNDQPVPLSLLASSLNVSPVSVNEMCRKLQDQGLVIYQPYKGALLTSEGQQIAHRILRRHRLWEVFLVEKLDLAYEEAHDIACQLEHATSDLMADRLDAFLGYPAVNPCGARVPRGFSLPNNRPTVPLTALTPGQRARVVRCDLKGTALNYLNDQGIRPGACLQVAASTENGVLVQTDGGMLSLTKELAQAVWLNVSESVDEIAMNPAVEDPLEKTK